MTRIGWAAGPGRQRRWGWSPAIPTVASALLATLWAFSVFNGWAVAAFCRHDEVVSAACRQRVEASAGLSALPAGAALALTLLAWLLPRGVDGPRRLLLLGVAVALWIAAEAVLFVAGETARP